jgi:hypothetical protein
MRQQGTFKRPPGQGHQAYSAAHCNTSAYTCALSPLTSTRTTLLGSLLIQEQGTHPAAKAITLTARFWTHHHCQRSNLSTKLHHFRDHVTNGSITLQYIPTQEQLAAIATKHYRYHSSLSFELLSSASNHLTSAEGVWDLSCLRHHKSFGSG